MERFEENEQQVLEVKRLRLLEEAKVEMERNLHEIDLKITFYKDVFSDYFKRVEKDSKVNMTWKFSQLNLPFIDFELVSKQLSPKPHLKEEEPDKREDDNLLDLNIKDIDQDASLVEKVPLSKRISITSRRDIKKQLSHQAKMQFKEALYSRSRNLSIQSSHSLSKRRGDVRKKVELRKFSEEGTFSFYQRSRTNEKNVETRKTARLSTKEDKGWSQVEIPVEQAVEEKIRRFQEQNLEHLNLEKLCIEDSHIPLFSGRLKFTRNLKSLSLRNNFISNLGVRRLLADLNPHLQEIDLSHNLINSISLTELIQVIKKQQTSLAVIRLAGSNIKRAN